MTERETGFAGWAIVELRGQKRLGGRISEVTVAGAPFIRIDVPHPNDSTLVRATYFYNPSAVYAITPTTEEIACAIARGAPAPAWEAGGGRRMAVDAGWETRVVSGES